MQTDGNFVVYNGASAPLYHTGTHGMAGTRLVAQGDSNVVLYGPGGAPFATNWHTTRGATTSGNTAAWGWCTWLALERFRGASGVWPRFSADAFNWDNSARAAGWQVQSQPASHSIVVFEKSSPSSVGHVAWVNGVQYRSDGWYISVTEMSYDGTATRATGHVRDHTYKHGPNMSYITAPEL